VADLGQVVIKVPTLFKKSVDYLAGGKPSALGWCLILVIKNKYLR